MGVVTQWESRAGVLHNPPDLRASYAEKLGNMGEGEEGEGGTGRGLVTQTPARSVHGIMDEMRQIHTDYRNPVEEKG